MIESVISSAGEIVSLEEVKRQLGVWDDADDLRVLLYLEAARGYCERWSESTLRLATVRSVAFRQWTDSGCLLGWAPVVSVDAVTYWDADGVEQTLPTSFYRTHVTGQGRGLVEWTASGSPLPNTQERQDAITIRYTTGWPSREDAPSEAKASILLVATHLYGEDDPRDLRYAKQAAMNLLSTQSHPSYA